MSSDRTRIRLHDIVDNADWIAEYLGDADLEQFLRNRQAADAVERCIERIAEAIVQIGEVTSAEIGIAVPWHDVRNLGNRLRHEYRRIDRSVIYATARDDVPALRAAALRALDR